MHYDEDLIKEWEGRTIYRVGTADRQVWKFYPLTKYEFDSKQDAETFQSRMIKTLKSMPKSS